MAGKRRTIDPEIYAHPFLLRQPLACRYLYHYLIECAADDEGRFKVDSFMLVRECFSPLDHVTPQKVEAFLAALSQEEGQVLLYEVNGSTCGFLTGWYEHQKIDKRYRSESSLPPPPTAIHSWEQVDEIRLEYATSKGFKDADKVPAREALRWKEQQAMATEADSRESHARVTREPRESHAPDWRGEEGTGEEGIGGVMASPSPPVSPVPAGPPIPPETPRPAPPVGDAKPQRLLVDVPEAEKPTKAKPPKKTDEEKDPEGHKARVAATKRLWTAYGLPGKPGGPGYGEVVARIMNLAKEHGPDAFDRWAEIVRESPPVPEVGTGLPQWFKREVEDAMKTRWQWDPVKMNKAAGVKHSHGYHAAEQDHEVGTTHYGKPPGM